jgi:chitodextrinase
VEQADPSSNYGGSSFLRVDGGADAEVDSYLSFSVTGLTGVVQQATLSVQATADGSLLGPALYTSGSGWSESTITWNNRPPHAPTATGVAGPVAPGSWVQFDVTNVVQATGRYDFALATSSWDGINFDSRESTSPPQLVLTGVRDTAAPSSPSTLGVSAATDRSLALSWTAATDNVGVVGYHLYLNGSNVGTTDTTGSTLTGLTCGTSYELGVDAYDAAGNRSPEANVVGATAPCGVEQSSRLEVAADTYASQATPDTVHGSYSYLRVAGADASTRNSYLRFDLGGLNGPVVDATLRVHVKSASGVGFDVHPGPTTSWQESTLTWNSAPAFSSAIAGNSGPLNADTWVSVDVTPLVQATGSASFVLATTDPIGFYLDSRESGNGPELVVTSDAGADVQAPPPPDALTIAGETRTSLSFTWSATTDNGGVAGYGVYLDGVPMGTTTTPSYTAGSLSCGRSYTFAVDAYDDAGNHSAPSSIQASTSPCPDTQPPTPPALLTQTDASGTGVSLAWEPSIDDVGVAGYLLYVNGVKAGGTALTMYTVGDLACGTSYAVGVAAFDAAGNVSQVASTTASTSACATPSGTVNCDIVASPGAGTAQRAIDSAQVGQTVCLHGGIYTPPDSSSPALHFTHGGSSGAPMTVTSYPGEQATVESANTGTDLVDIPESANYVTLDKLTLIGPANGYPIHVQGDDLTFSNSDISSNGTAAGACVLLGSGSYGAARNVSVVHDVIHDCGTVPDSVHNPHCIYANNTRNLLLQYDLIYDCVGYVIQLYPQAMGTLVDHVTADAGPFTTRGGVVIEGESGYANVSSNNTVQNSIFVGAVTAELAGGSSSAQGTGNSFHDNCVLPAPGGADFDGSNISYSSNLHTNPLFVSTASHDYQLQAGSPCAGKGLPLP